MTAQTQEAASTAASSIVAAAAKTAPPVTVSGMAWYGVHLNDLVLLVTLAYTLAQFYFLVRDRLQRRRQRGGRR